MPVSPPPPPGDPAARPAPAGAPRDSAVPARAPDALAPVKSLLRELALVFPALRGPGPELTAAAADPRSLATPLAASLLEAGAQQGLSPAQLLAAVDQALGRALAEAPGGVPPKALTALGDALRAALAAPAATPARATPPLRILVEELRSAVAAELGPTEPPPLPAPGAEAGNVASSLVRWLTVVAAGAGVPLATLRAAVELALERTRLALAPEPPLPPLEGELLRAHEVLALALGRPAARTPDPLPTYRPDLAVPSGARAARRARPATRPGGDAPTPPEHEPAAEAAAEEEQAPPPPPDLKGPMELARQFLEDLWSAPAGVAARHFVFPAGRWDGREWRGCADATLLAGLLEARRGARSAVGTARERIVMLRVEPLAAGIAVVHMRLARETPAGEVQGESEAALTAVRTVAGWRIAVLIEPGAEAVTPPEKAGRSDRPGRPA